jgi:uncharacterized membrane protein YebE (DUF533 family)
MQCAVSKKSLWIGCGAAIAATAATAYWFWRKKRTQPVQEPADEPVAAWAEDHTMV